MPAHHFLVEDDTDEELNDEQIRALLNEAAQRMRAKAASQPVTNTEAPFRLPKLNPGHIADTHETTKGNITRLDQSKLVDAKEKALANGIKKIEDPLQIKKQKDAVRTTYSFTHPPVMISIPNFILSRLGPRLGCPPAKLKVS